MVVLEIVVNNAHHKIREVVFFLENGSKSYHELYFRYRFVQNLSVMFEMSIKHNRENT